MPYHFLQQQCPDCKLFNTRVTKLTQAPPDPNTEGEIEQMDVDPSEFVNWVRERMAQIAEEYDESIESEDTDSDDTESLSEDDI